MKWTLGALVAGTIIGFSAPAAADGGVLVGRVLSDETGLPLEGASVRIDGSAAAVVTDDQGRYTIATSAPQVTLVVEKAQHLTVYRSVSVTEGTGTVPIDARLTTLSDAQLVGSGDTAVTATARASQTTVTITVPGELAGTTVQLTPLSGQGLPALLPLGWSVVTAFDLRGSVPLPSLSATAEGLLASGTVHLVSYDVTFRAWRLAQTANAADGVAALELPAAGTYALVAADPGDPLVPIPPLNGILQGVAPLPLPETAMGAGSVEPGVVPPGGATAIGRVTLQGDGLPPSGTVVQVEVDESYQLGSGEQVTTEKTKQDLLLYRVPQTPESSAPAGSLHAALPITPSVREATAQVQSGNVHVAVLSGREDARGAVGGSSAVMLEAGAVRLVVAGGSLPEDTAIVLQAFDGFSSFVPEPPGTYRIVELYVEFGGRTLQIPAELSLDATGLPADSTYVVSRVERVNEVPRLTVVALAEVSGERLVTIDFPGLPGVVRGGTHVVYRLPAPIGFVAGHVTRSGQPVQGVVTTAALPFVGIGDPSAAGSYIVAAVPGTIEVTASVPGVAAAQTAVVAAGSIASLDFGLEYASIQAIVTPEDGAIDVPRTAVIQVAGSSAIEPATILAENLTLRQLGADGSAVEDVPVRFVHAASGRSVSVIPTRQLEELTRYRFEASNLRDAFGAPITVPSVAFTTRKDDVQAANAEALVFSFPDAQGLVTISLPPASLPPGTHVMVVNSTWGDVVAMTVDNEGSLSGRIRGTLNDRMLVTVTLPDGSIVRFERSQFYDAVTGLTAIGQAGGKVTGPGGVEIRVPDGAAPQPVKLKISSVALADMPTFADGQPQVPSEAGLHFGTGLRIETPNRDGFAREVDLAFPLPDGLPEDPTHAFFHVYRRIERPDGQVLFQTVDHAFVEGEGEERRVVTASPPFSGYIGNIGSFGMTPGMFLGAQPALHTYAILMWTYDDLMPGRALTGAVTGRVVRAEWLPNTTEPTYRPVAGAVVTAVDGNGQPLLFAGDASGQGAVTAEDGSFTFWDEQYQGGQIRISAVVPGAVGDAPSCDSPATPTFACGVALEAVVQDLESPALRLYRAVAQGNITFPSSALPEAPASASIELYRLSDPDVASAVVHRTMAGNVVEVGTRLQVGVDYGADTNGRPTVRIDGNDYDVSPDSDDYVDPVSADWVTSEFALTEEGSVLIEVRVPRETGGDAVFTRSIYVMKSGETVSTAPDLENPPRVSAWSPKDGARYVAPTTALTIWFSEPVTHVPGNVRVVPVDENDTATGEPIVFTPEELSGIGRVLGPDGVPVDESLAYIPPPLGDNHLVSVLLVRPRGSLRFSQRYRVVLNEGVDPAALSGIRDRDHDASGAIVPKGLPPQEAFFSTQDDGQLGENGTWRSPGLALLGDRAYLVENSFQSGLVRVFDVGRPSNMVEITQQTTGIVVPRPTDIVGAIDTDMADRLLAVSVASTEQARPSSVYLFDVSHDEHTFWVGASTLVPSGAGGYIARMQIHGPRLYAATVNKGVQVVELAGARDAYRTYLAADPSQSVSERQASLRAELNTDGRGIGHGAVVATVSVAVRPGDRNQVNDIAVGDVEWDGITQPVAFTTGDNPLAIVVPQKRIAVFAGGLETPTIKMENQPPPEGGFEPTSRDLGHAIALHRVADPAGNDRQIVIVAGEGRVRADQIGPFQPARVLMVVDVARARDEGDLGADHLEGPAILGAMVLGVGGTIEDIAVFGSMVVVGTDTGQAEVVSLYDPARPTSMGIRSSVGGRLAISADGVLFSTANGLLGSAGPDGLQYGLHSTLLQPQELLSLKTPRVIAPLVLDQKQQAAVDGESGPVFVLTRPARIRFETEDGRSVLARLDDPAAASTLWDGDEAQDIVDAGTPHQLWIDDPLLPKRLDAKMKFRLIAIDAADPDVVEVEDGVIERDRRDRDVLPVGTTFVRNVSVSNGHLVLSRTDFELPGRNFQLKMTRTYSSSARRWDGLLGANWDWPYEGRIERVGRGAEQRYVVRTVTGTTQEFRQTGPCQFETPLGYHTSLKCDPEAPAAGESPDLVFTDFQKTEHRFRRLPKVLKTSFDVWWIHEMREPHGDVLRMRYDDLGRITRISEVHPQDEVVHTLRFEYTQAGGDDRVAAVFGPAHIVVRYGYDEDGNLRRVVREGRNENGDYDTHDRIESYEYTEASAENAPHKLTAYVDPNGVRTEYEWERLDEAPPWMDPRIEEVREVDSQGGPAAEWLITRPSVSVVNVKNPRGATTTYTLNDHFNVTQAAEPHGRVTQFIWDTATLRKTGEIDAKGRRTDFAYYPETGNLRSETIFTLGLGNVTTTHDYAPEFNVPNLLVDAEGRKTSWAVDPAKGHIDSMTNAVRDVTVYRRDEAGNVTSQDGPRVGASTTFDAYNDFGQAEQITDAEDGVTLRGYDGRGRLEFENNQRTGLVTKYLYDAMDRVRRVEQIPGDGQPALVTTTEYWSDGQPRLVTNGPGQPNELTTEYILDGRNRVRELVKTTGPGADTDGVSFGESQTLLWSYKYDPNGNLEFEEDPRRVLRQYAYDLLDRRLSTTILTGPEATPAPTTPVESSSYDSLVKLTDTDISGNTIWYGYDELYRVTSRQIQAQGGEAEPLDADTYDRVGNRLTHTDSSNRQERWGYDPLDRVEVHENAKNQIVRTTYEDEPGSPATSHVNLSRVHDETRNLVTTYRHDLLGREIERKVHLAGPGGDNVVYTWATSHDGAAKGPNDVKVVLNDSSLPAGSDKVVLTLRDGLGRVVEERVAPDSDLGIVSYTTYDALGNKSSVIDPEAHKQQFHLDGLGRTRAATDGEGHTSYLTYYDESLVKARTNRRGHRTELTYDNVGRPRFTRVYDGTSGALVTEQEITYDDQQRRRTERNGRDKSTTYVLDARGRTVEEIGPDVGSGDPPVRSRLFHYEGEELRWQTDRRGNKTEFHYDELHRLLTTIDPPVPNVEPAPVNPIIRYDDHLNQRTEIDRRGTPSVVQLDPLGRVRSVTRGDVPQESTTFDAEGNVRDKVDGGGSITRNTYDAAWRLSAVTVAPDDPAEMTTTYALYKDGLRKTESDLRGPVATYKYDGEHRLETLEDALGKITEYEYDHEGNRERVIEPGTKAASTGPTSTGYGYDALNRLVSVQQGDASGPITRYVRDPNGNVEDIFERASPLAVEVHRVHVEFDALDREIERRQFVGAQHTLISKRGYDPDGNPNWSQDASLNETRTQYDALNRPIWSTFVLGPGLEAPPKNLCRLDYKQRDPNGNPRVIDEFHATAADGCSASPSRTVQRTYDALDRLRSEMAALPEGGDQTIGYDYYENGLRKLVDHPGGGRTTYEYDAANRLWRVSTTGWSNGGTYSYYPDGLLQRLDYPNGVSAHFAYEATDRVSSIDVSQGGQTVSRYAYSYYDNGDRWTQRETNGGPEERTTYQYDALRRLSHVEYPGGRAVQYNYDGFGNRFLETEYQDGTQILQRRASFDGANRLLSVDAGPEGNTVFGWNDNGSLASRTDSTGTTRFVYDPLAQLTEARKVTGAGADLIVGRYQYDFLGRRVKTIGEDGVRQFVYDDTSVAGEFSLGGGLLARNVWGGDRLLSVNRPTLGIESFYHQDALGSAVSITDGSGGVVARNRLDAWGNFRIAEDENPTSPAAAANRYAFTGYLFDRETDLYYAKARYYDPQFGRFLTQDSYLGKYDSPPSLHRYVYVHNRPTFWNDPTGHAPPDIDDPLTQQALGPELVEELRQGQGEAGIIVQNAGGGVLSAAATYARGVAHIAREGVENSLPPVMAWKGLQQARGLVDMVTGDPWAPFDSAVSYFSDTLDRMAAHQARGEHIRAGFTIGEAATETGLTVVGTIEGGVGLLRAGVRSLPSLLPRKPAPLPQITVLSPGEVKVRLGGVLQKDAMTVEQAIEVYGPKGGAIEARYAETLKVTSDDAIQGYMARSGRRMPPEPENWRGRYNAARRSFGKPELPESYDAHHRIPRVYEDHPEFGEFDFHAPHNIRGVKGSRARVNMHQRVTNEWEEFRALRPDAMRDEIERFAAFIDKKYGKHWFK